VAARTNQYGALKTQFCDRDLLGCGNSAKSTNTCGSLLTPLSIFGKRRTHLIKGLKEENKKEEAPPTLPSPSGAADISHNDDLFLPGSTNKLTFSLLLSTAAVSMTTPASCCNFKSAINTRDGKKKKEKGGGDLIHLAPRHGIDIKTDTRGGGGLTGKDQKKIIMGFFMRRSQTCSSSNN